jgi:hypothetical protein
VDAIGLLVFGAFGEVVRLVCAPSLDEPEVLDVLVLLLDDPLALDLAFKGVMGGKPLFTWLLEYGL